MGHHRQDGCQDPQGQLARIPVAHPEIDDKRVYGREEEYEGPVPRVLRLIQVIVIDGHEESTEEGSSASDQPANREVEGRHREYSEERRQEPQPQLIEWNQRTYQVVVHEVQQRP